MSQNSISVPLDVVPFVVSQPDKLLTTAEVCKVLQVSKRTLIRYANAGLIPRIQLSSRCIRFSQDDVRRFVKGNRKRG